MNRTELKERLNEVFRDVFDDSRIIVNENTTSVLLLSIYF